MRSVSCEDEKIKNGCLYAQISKYTMFGNPLECVLFMLNRMFSGRY